MNRRPSLAVTLLLVFGVMFGWLFHDRYWLWRDCIAASASSCVTPQGQNLTSGGMIWGIVSLGFFAAALWRQWRSRRQF